MSPTTSSASRASPTAAAVPVPQHRPRHIREVTPLSGAALQAKLVGRGAAYADIDNDGDLDVLVTANNGPARLFRNDGGNRNNAIRIKTIGSRSNRDGIGARVEVSVRGARRWQIVKTGSSYGSQSELPLTFGLGANTSVESVRVRWPSGQVDTDGALEANQIVTVREGRSPRRRRSSAPRRSSVIRVANGAGRHAARRRGRERQPAREDASAPTTWDVARLERFDLQKRLPRYFGEALATRSSLAAAHINLSTALLYLPDLDGAREAPRPRPSPGRRSRRIPGPHRLRPESIGGGDCGVSARSADRFPRRRHQRQPRPGLPGAAPLRRRDRAVRAALADEPYNVTATYNLALALARGGQAAEASR